MQAADPVGTWAGKTSSKPTVVCRGSSAGDGMLPYSIVLYCTVCTRKGLAVPSQRHQRALPKDSNNLKPRPGSDSLV